MSGIPNLHGPATASGEQEGIFWFYKVPLGAISLFTAILAQEVAIKVLGIIAIIALIVMPKKIMEIIGAIFYVLVFVAVIAMIILGSS